eukprot:jgi/Chrzof1/12859/Cz07g09270.t1
MTVSKGCQGKRSCPDSAAVSPAKRGKPNTPSPLKAIYNYASKQLLAANRHMNMDKGPLCAESLGSRPTLQATKSDKKRCRAPEGNDLETASQDTIKKTKCLTGGSSPLVAANQALTSKGLERQEMGSHIDAHAYKPRDCQLVGTQHRCQSPADTGHLIEASQGSNDDQHDVADITNKVQDCKG